MSEEHLQISDIKEVNYIQGWLRKGGSDGTYTRGNKELDKGIMKVLVACESSERVKKAFQDRGHEAHSCDLKAGEQGLPNHHQCDIRELLKEYNDYFDLGIFHPDCTRLANSGVRWLFKILGRYEQMVRDAEFFNWCLNVKIPMVVAENPIQHRYARELIRIYDQIIQPWQFGDKESKATCLWLRGLPPLMPLFLYKPNDVKQSVWQEPPSPNRKTNRARTSQGIADAMAEQWG